MVVVYLLISIALIIILTTRYKVHPFIVLFLVAIFYGLCAGMPLQKIISSVNKGFGGTLGNIGLLIIFGVIIGAFLENSGGAYKIADKILDFTGEERVPTAMGIIGYFVSIPVFADSGFILLSPLNKSLSKKAKITLSGSAVSLALGLTATHTLVPPTPGPIAAAGILNADLGLVMMLAIPVSAVALVAALFYSRKYVAKTYIDPIPEVNEEEMEKRLKKAPGALKSTLPVFVPIILIILRSIVNMYKGSINPEVVSITLFIGEPFIALLIGMLLAFLLPKKLEPQMLSTNGWIGKALKQATSVILITGAGGIFGKVLQNSGIAKILGHALSGVHLSIFLPFLLAAAIKTAQGSSTVALITAASIMTPLMSTLGFTTGLERAIVVLAIGAGSAVFSHANDSFFWVVTRLSGMDTKTGYQLFSPGTFVLGATAIITLFVINLIIG
ncbi:MAG TPA: GntP family permease [Balneolaceae bacterium]|nr:GntP family permease [Balneolaceae bacterium]